MTEPGPGERECPSCGFAVDREAEVCPYCAYEFPVAKAGVRPMVWLFIGLMILFAFPALAYVFGLFG